MLQNKYDINSGKCSSQKKNENIHENSIQKLIRDEKIKGEKNQAETVMLRKKIQELEEQLNKSRVSSNEQNQSIVEPYLALSKKKSTTISAENCETP